MTTLGFYGSRLPSGSSSRTNTPIVTLTERVDCLCESTERLQAVQASESNSKRGQKKLPTILSVSQLNYTIITCVFESIRLYRVTSEHCKNPT